MPRDQQEDEARTKIDQGQQARYNRRHCYRTERNAASRLNLFEPDGTRQAYITPSTKHLHRSMEERRPSVQGLPRSLANDHICLDAVATCPTHAESKITMITATITVVPARLCVAL